MANDKFLIYVSSTEHNRLATLGKASTIPEVHGCDILSLGAVERIGFQRKEVSDFINSLADGRLSKELGQMESSTLITRRIIILEGDFRFTISGESSIPYANFTLGALRSIITQLQIRGLIVHTTADINDTVQLVLSITNYLAKPSHRSLDRRPSARSPWGTVNSKAFAIHLLQSFPSIGPELADRIYSHFNSTVPIQWTVTEQQLREVAGIGPQLASRLITALRPIINE